MKKSSYANPEGSWVGAILSIALVERGKVWAVSDLGRESLRDVPIPRETVPGGEGPAVWIRRGAYRRAIRGNAEGEPGTTE